MVVMLVAGIGCLLAGLLAIGFGIPVKEFSFGNTLILTGAVTACTGLVILGLWAVVRELKTIAQRLGPGVSAGRGIAADSCDGAAAPSRGGQAAASCSAATKPRRKIADGAESAAQPSAGAVARGSSGARSRPQRTSPAPEPAETAPAAKPRRNLMFSSSSRRERERAQARAAESPATDFPPAPAPAATPPAPEPGEPPPATFDDAWPKSERSRSADVPPQRRGGRAPSTFSEATPAPPGKITIRRLCEMRISRR